MAITTQEEFNCQTVNAIINLGRIIQVLRQNANLPKESLDTMTDALRGAADAIIALRNFTTSKEPPFTDWNA